MSCNGHNHRVNCDCDFKGGHRGASPPPSLPPLPLLGELAPMMRKRLFNGLPRPCPRCGDPTYFVRAAKGGSYRAAADGSKLRHNCRKEVPPRRLKWKEPTSRSGWFSATVAVTRERRTVEGQALLITSLVEGNPFRVRLQDGIQVDPTAPAMCRWSPDDPRVLEIAYPDNDTGELTGTCVRARRFRQ